MPPVPSPEDFAALDAAAIVCRLPDLGSLRIEGPDAASFLHGQLSSDVAALRPGILQRSTYNSPKGRVLADLVVWRNVQDEHRFEALVAADLAAPIAKRLGMFVLRAKVKLRDETQASTRIGVAGPAAPAVIAAVLGSAPAVATAAFHEQATVAALPEGGFVVVTDIASGLAEALAQRARAVDPALWHVGRVRAGVPLVTAATSDQFVVQALNFDALGGVSFQKGCYPGQEIVARTQYLGRLKERLYAFGVAGTRPPPGMRLFAASFGEQPCGTVIASAPSPDPAMSDLLAVAQRSAAEAETLRLGAPDGPALARRTLPYALPEPAAPRGRIAAPL